MLTFSASRTIVICMVFFLLIFFAYYNWNKYILFVEELKSQNVKKKPANQQKINNLNIIISCDELLYLFILNFDGLKAMSTIHLNPFLFRKVYNLLKKKNLMRTYIIQYTYYIYIFIIYQYTLTGSPVTYKDGWN